MSKIVRILAAFVVALYLAFLAGLFFAQRSLIYPVARSAIVTPPVAAPGLEALRLPTSAGEIEVLFLPATSAAAAARRPAMLFAHGNGEVVDHWTRALGGFRERGVGVLLVEYPGYGRSSGEPSEPAIRIAIDAAYDHLAADPRVDPGRIFAYGRSLGGGAVCLLARDRPLRALILESTFPSLSMFTARYLAPAFLLRDRFDNVSALEGFPGPVLVIHGRGDQLVPWKEAERLAAASPHATFRLYDCGHGCWDPDRLPFWNDVDAFLSKAGIRP